MSHSLHTRTSDSDPTTETTAPASAEPSQRRSWAVMIVALVAQILVVLDISVVNTAMPVIGADLGLASGELQWMVTAYLLLSGGGLLLGGRIADLLPPSTPRGVHHRSDRVHDRVAVQRVRVLGR
jgi:MFS family permease